SRGGVGVLRSRGKSGSGAGASTVGDCPSWSPAAAPVSVWGFLPSCPGFWLSGPGVSPSGPAVSLSGPAVSLSGPAVSLPGPAVAPALSGRGVAPPPPGPPVLSSCPEVAPDPWAPDLAWAAGGASAAVPRAGALGCGGRSLTYPSSSSSAPPGGFRRSPEPLPFPERSAF